jgi:hypothetical protein
MNDVRRMEFNPGVAFLDQHHAEAMDALRRAEEFVLLYDATEEEGFGAIGVMCGATLHFLLRCIPALHEATAEALVRSLREVNEEEE